MKWPKRKEAVMKETFSKTSTTHKAKNYELKDCYREFVYRASPNVFSCSIWLVIFSFPEQFHCHFQTQNRNLSSKPALPAKLALKVSKSQKQIYFCISALASKKRSNQKSSVRESK